MIKVDMGKVEMNGTNADLLTEASFAVATAAYAMADNGKSDVLASASLYAITLAAAKTLTEKGVNVNFQAERKQDPVTGAYTKPLLNGVRMAETPKNDVGIEKA